ncbi:MAG: carboxypeptidase-like regulatory domain-containing protein, partial [Thermoplasmata archaeon]
AAAGACISVGTNASGGYWISLPPGLVGLQYSAVGYVQNQSLHIRVCSDCFVEANGVTLWRDALLKGIVVDSITGTPLGGAALTLCPVGPFNLAYCNQGVPETTAPDGSFTLEPPMGSYVFNLSYPGFVPETISMDLAVGQVVNLGTIAMLPVGTVEGVVVSGLSDAPLPNVTVLACAPASAVPCTSGVTNGTGVYEIQTAPGYYLLSAVAPGYGQGTATANVGATEQTEAPTIVLPYDGPGGTFRVVGNVEALGGNGSGIEGATVIALSGGVLQGAAQTGPGGRFQLDLVWGVYSLEVTASGYGGRQMGITVHGEVTGVTVALDVFLWTIRGTARSVTSGSAAAAVPITEGSQLLNLTDSSGGFEFALANGSFLLTAGGFSGAVEVFDPLPFPIELRGPVAPVALSLVPHEVAVSLTALEAGTGALVQGASFVVTGAPLAGGYENVTVGLTGGVWASTLLPLGAYSVTARAPGFLSATGQFRVLGAPVTMNLTMTRNVPTPERPLPWVAIGIVVGTGLAVALAIVWIRDRRRQRPRRLEGTLMPPTDRGEPYGDSAGR